MLLCAMADRAVAQEGGGPIDWKRHVQPIFEASCAGGACHIGRATSGVDLTTYESTLASVGALYGFAAVEPGDAVSSPLWDKIAHDEPIHGARMPLGRPPLSPDEILVIESWINQGALEETRAPSIRGDINRDDGLDISDVLAILNYLFHGDVPPHCEPVADVNDDEEVDITDAVFALEHLFLGGEPPPPLSADEREICDVPNRAPVVQPIGTIEGAEGVEMRFRVVATDQDRDDLTFVIESGPDGVEMDPRRGIALWTPGPGQAGDHRIRVLVTDDGMPSRSAFATGLLRVRPGNQAPIIDDVDTVYGRESITVQLQLRAHDGEGDTLTFELLEGPDGASLDRETGTFSWSPRVGDAGEHVVRFRVHDDGAPARSSDGHFRLVIVERDSLENQAPSIPARGIHRSFVGMPIEFLVGGSDPDGDEISYEVENLPDGASLDAESGRFVWTPAEDQLGPFYVPVKATDTGVPPAEVEAVLLFRISPHDPCFRGTCDAETGCVEGLPALEEACCGDEPEVRIAEPVADCPEGRVLYVGRNRRGFGRIQNCDRLRVTPFGQGGHTVSLNVEARCVDHMRPISVRFRLETEEYLLFDRESSGPGQLRSDGFVQRIGFFMEVDRTIPVFALEATPALLTCVLTDAVGVRLERRIRVILTRAFLSDLPEPDTQDVPASEAGCIGCHRPVDSHGERHGIEDAHPWHPLSCTDCHGGNPNATTRQAAHEVPFLGDPAYLRGLSSDQLDQQSRSYLQFVNPGDLRVADRGCGSRSSANNGSGCHQSTVEAVQKNVMATYAGHYTLPRYLAGSQSRDAQYAAVDITDFDFDPETAPEGAVHFLRALREPPPEAPRDSIGTCIDAYLPKSCPTCHLNSFGPDNSAGNYRSSGCTACHMVYDDDGLSRSDDPTIDKDFPSHPRKHQLTSAIPTEQCAHCHFQGGRIGLAYRGIREGGFPPDKTPTNGVTLGKVLHAHGEDYYFTDEDDSNDIDETPPDVHYAAGMDCVDCHIGGDVHGDGYIYASERYQVGILCEDCHGTVREEIQPDPVDGEYKNAKGFALKRVRRAEDGRMLLELAVSGREIEIPQIHRLLESGVNQAMTEAMGVNEHGFSHTDSMECYTCHTSWRQTCFGCHVTIDDRSMGRNHTTGLDSVGQVGVARNDYSLDFFALGTNTRGKITPLCSSMAVFVSYIDENGETKFRDRRRTSGDGKPGFGWNPFHHHTVSRVPQNCDRCHPVERGADNTALLRETYGFGTGRFNMTDGEGNTYDVSAFLDEDGELVGDFPHPGTGPVPSDVRERALSIPVTPHPRQ